MHLRAGLALGSLLFVLPSCGGGAPDEPDAAVEALFAGLAKDDPGAAWDLLPESYRKDLDAVVAEFAKKMPVELYDTGMATARKLVKMLDEKQEFVLGFPMLQMMLPVKPDDLKKHWSDVMGALDALLSSDLKTHSGLSRLDIGDFLSDTGGELMSTVHELAKLDENADWPDFGNASAEIVSVEGDKAKVKVKMPGERDTEIEMIRVDGVWVPADMATGWKETMQDARQQIASMPLSDPADTQRMLAMLKQADGVLDEALAAKTQDEFNAAIGKLMQGR